MRFFLDSAVREEIESASRLPFVAGVTTNPGILSKAGVADAGAVMEAAVSMGRRDWKVWVQLPEADAQTLVAKAADLNDRLSALTGGELAGPTLVVKVLPLPESLFAASVLIRQGFEVCVTGIANPLQALGVLALPQVESLEHGEIVTEGPPASRTPHTPGYIAFYVGRVSDTGRDGVETLFAVNQAMAACASRTRILAASIRSRDVLESIVSRLSSSPKSLVDMTLSSELLSSLAHDPVTSAAMAQFRSMK